MTRTACIVPFCRRTRVATELPEWICADHWKLTDAATRRAYSKWRRRARLASADDLTRIAHVLVKLWGRLKRQAIERGMGI